MERPNRKKFNIRSNKSQINYLCHYMSVHKRFASGEYSSSYGQSEYNAEWDSLKRALDELGPSRTLEQWKTCWRDQKRKARAEGGALNKAINATGNRSEIPELSENAALVLSTIGMEMAVGLGMDESPIGFNSSSAAVPHTNDDHTYLCTIPSTSQNYEVPIIPPLPPGPSMSPHPSTSPVATVLPTPTPNRPLSQPAPRRLTAVRGNLTRMRRQRREHPSERFLNAQLQLNADLQEHMNNITAELRRSNDLKERLIQILQRNMEP